ncbi:hypothetical protein [Sphingomonas bacterium]|uniref:hypothetical protein n=1 Tax=Sphingomonas bacterium TaxID=1895847 RepID=UPI001576CEAA|nr:hypothetical protein [Sphingomonas bacterium]
MTVNAELHRVYEFQRPEPLRVEIHDIDCPCCAPPDDRQLTFADLGRLAWWGMAAGTAIAIAIDPHGAWQALASCFGRLS